MDISYRQGQPTQPVQAKTAANVQKFKKKKKKDIATTSLAGIGQ